MHILTILLLVLGLCCTLAAAGGPAVTLEDGTVRHVPARGPKDVHKMKVSLPRTWMMATDALVCAYRQTGLLYAVLSANLDAPIGPLPFGEPITVEDLVSRAAAATGTSVRWVNGVAVFEPAGAGQADPAGKEKCAGDAARTIVASLESRGDSSIVVELTRLAGHDDGSVRIHALAALDRLEGDFMRQAWPGRVSVLEVLADKIDRQSLLFALEEGGPPGGRNWKLAVSALARAREPLLARYLWNHVWQNQPGTMELGLWALGRCGDPSGGWAMRARVKDTQTNDPSGRYLAAMSLGQLDESNRLGVDRGSGSVELRRASAFGLGFCRAGNDEAIRYLGELLTDADPAVRFVACQSLARLGGETAIGKLTALSADAKTPTDLRASAMTALVAFSRPQAAKTVFERLADPNPLVRATAAGLLGELGGPSAEAGLARLAEDRDRRVRQAAVCSLASLGADAGISRAGAVLDDPTSDADLRISAMLGLGRSLSPAAAEPLAKVAHDTATPQRLRNYAVLGLARLASRAGQERIVELADRASPKYLPLAVRHLQLKTPRLTAEFLIPYLTQADRDGACNAAGRLAELGYGPAVVELLEGSDVLDNHTRMEHMWGTVRASGREVTLALAQAAASKRSSIRRTAAFALGGRLYPEAVDALVRLARDQQADVRLAAARSLGVTPDPLGIEVLIKLATRDKDLPVAIEAVRALRRRDFRDLPQVKELFRRIAGTPRDAGGVNPEQPTIADQPANSFVLRTWDDHPEEDLVSNLTYESSLCYDAHRRRIVMWGAHGRRYDTPQTGQTWFFDAGPGTWSRLTDSRHWPNGVCGVRGTMYDDANRVVVSPRSGGSNAHGWHNALRANLMHSSPWVLDVTTDQWYAARALTIWSGGYMPGSHDPRHGVILWWRDKLMAFDAYANCWIEFKPEGPGPECPRDTGGAFDPQTGRFIAIGPRSTWAFDPATNAWTDLRPAGDQPPPCPMVYDSTNDVMLAFKVVGDHVGVWAFHIRENRWEQLPAVYPCPARGQIWDVTYDSQNKVAVIGGTNPNGITASLNSRETWTYRYKPASQRPPALRSPHDVRCVTAADGSVKVTWTPASGAKAAGYAVECGVGQQPWLLMWERVGKVAGAENAFSHSPARKALAFYRVIAVGPDGGAAPPSPPGRTAPRIIHQVTAAVRAEGGVHVRWAASQEGDVIGYHVYRAPVDLGLPWSTRFNPEDVAGSLNRITSQPLAATELIDIEAKVAGPADELTWPRTFAYVVRPVNAWGLEGGPSPVTLALPDPPGPVRVIPWADGRRLVLWSTCDSGGVDSYLLMRMDCWHRDYVFRVHAAPLATPAFWDGQDFPTTDRRRYYASGLDPLGTIGTPTSGAWSHGDP